jgi:sugar lactone lactonase YvrE
MHKGLAPNAGNLYRISKKGKVSAILRGTTVSNGMAWSPDHKRFYYSDTATYELWSFKYDTETAGITDKRVCFKIPETYGGADGLCIDTEGMLWIAHWGGNCVRRWDPHKGVVLQTIKVPAPHVTSCCFGGPSHNILYITTAESGLDEAALKEFPGSGNLFQCHLPFEGYPTNYVNANTLHHVSQFKE